MQNHIEGNPVAGVSLQLYRVHAHAGILPMFTCSCMVDLSVTRSARVALPVAATKASKRLVDLQFQDVAREQVAQCA